MLYVYVCRRKRSMSSSSEAEENLEDSKFSEELSSEAEGLSEGSSGDREGSDEELDELPDVEHRRKVGKKPMASLKGGEERKGKIKKESKSDGVAARPSQSAAGIVYLSRIPPFMKPHKVKHLLSRYGSVGRVYLKPEDPVVRQRRIKFKGNKKKNFTEGWVEFHDKRIAKTVALMLNNTPIGGKKRSYYHDDLWNIKYLSKFRWTHLTEKIAYEQAVREQKMRTEISQAKRENTHYLASVEKGKEIDAIVERKRKRGATEEEVTKLQRSYKQRKVSETAAQASGAESARKTAIKNKNPVSSSTKSHLISDSLLKKILPG